jgi:hypothetical protein
MTRATVEGLRRLVRPEDVAQLRGKTIAQVLPIQRPETRAREEEALAKEREELPVPAAPAPVSETDDAVAQPALAEVDASNQTPQESGPTEESGS